VGRPRVVADEPRPSLGADALRAGRDPADEPAHPHPEPDRRAASREVGDGAFVATVDAMCATLAGGTAQGLRRKAARSDHRKSARPNPLWCLSATEEYS
jgi:hypothetical protein